MSYTILTIPFNLKEKAEGEFLKKGFVFDDFYPDLFKSEESVNPFLHVTSLKNEDIKNASIKTLLKENFFPKNKKVYFLGDLEEKEKAIELVNKYVGKELDEKKVNIRDVKSAIVVLGNDPDKNKKSALENEDKNNIFLSQNQFFDLFNLIETLSNNKISSLSTESFFDKKHLKQVEGFVNQFEINESTQTTELSSRIKSKFHNLINFNPAKKNIPFEIEEIKIIFNSQSTTKKSIGFGFLKITIKWIPKIIVGEGIPDSKIGSDGDYYTDKNLNKNYGPKINQEWPEFKGKEFNLSISAERFITEISSIAEFLRYFGEYNKNKFNVFSENQNIFKSIIEEIKLNSKYDFLELFKFDELRNIRPIDFKSLIDHLFIEIFGLNSLDKYFDFGFSNEMVIKPYLLHLSNINKPDNLKFIDKNIDNLAFRLIRIPGKENVEINNSYNNESFISVPDVSTKQYVLNEGALVIEGIKTCSDLKNKYYPAFLYALNQKYLFNYLQEKINQLPLDKIENSIKYNAEALKTLQETMIYAEFSQIFTSISNYNEIDLFFKNLRNQFKIKELKDEFLDSINGISKITQIKESQDNELRLRKEEANRRIQEKAVEEARKVEETKRQGEIERSERISEFQSKRLNLVLLLLTIAQVWPNFLNIFIKSEDTRYFKANIIFYLSITIIGLVFYFIILHLISENKLTKKDFILKLKSYFIKKK